MCCFLDLAQRPREKQEIEPIARLEKTVGKRKYDGWVLCEMRSSDRTRLVCHSMRVWRTEACSSKWLSLMLEKVQQRSRDVLRHDLFISTAREG